jgi:hypothetical protein
MTKVVFFTTFFSSSGVSHAKLEAQRQGAVYELVALRLGFEVIALQQIGAHDTVFIEPQSAHFFLSARVASNKHARLYVHHDRARSVPGHVDGVGLGH